MWIEAIDALGEYACGRCLACAPRTAKKVGVGDPVQGDGIAQRLDDVGLTDKFRGIETSGPVLSIEGLRVRGRG